MSSTTFASYASQIDAKKTALRAAGISLPTDEAMRNSGRRRTPAKRELLRRIDERAAASGVRPVRQNY